MLDPFSFDLTNEQAAAIVPGRPTAMTIWRWETRGVRGVKLASIKSNGKRFTSRAALREFLLAISGNAPAAPSAAKAREKQTDQALAELDALGV